MQNLKHITLIIPTFNRPKFLDRLLNYYISKETPIHFLILDSSDGEIQELNKKAITTLAEKVQYITFPSTISVATKLLEGLKLVDTPFCAFCADDDLVFVDGLMQALTFLQNNTDYVCADGIYLNFNPIEKDVYLVVEYASKGVNANDPCARIFRLFQKYESLFYGVFKTQHALEIFTGVSKNSSLHYQELFQAAAALLIGKSHRLPVFYAARQHCNPADFNRDKWQTYYWFSDNSEEFLTHYLFYREELWNFYQKHVLEPQHSKDKFLHILDITHAMYFGLGCPPAYFHSVLQSSWPSDAFQTPNIYYDNICNQLKTPRRVWREAYIEKLFNWLHKKISSLYSIRDMKKLNSEVQKKLEMSWNCKLSAELRWLTSVDSFRNAYVELCRYMSLS